MYCLDLYQQFKASRRRAARRQDVTTTIEGHLRKTSLVPVISDFLLPDATRVIRELSLLNGVHDVFLMMADVRFAYQLPPASAGWIETFDVETGGTRIVSRREFARMARAHRGMAAAHRRPRARQRSRHRPRRPRSLGDGNDADRVRPRAAAAKILQMTTRRGIEARTSAVDCICRAGGSAAAQAPAAQRPPAPKAASPPKGVHADAPAGRRRNRSDQVLLENRSQHHHRRRAVHGRPDVRHHRDGQDQSRPRLQPARGVDDRPAAVRSGQGRHGTRTSRIAPWRYIQYEYTVRLIAEGLFDKGHRTSRRSRSRTTSSRRSAAAPRAATRPTSCRRCRCTSRSLVPTEESPTSATRA